MKFLAFTVLFSFTAFAQTSTYSCGVKDLISMTNRDGTALRVVVDEGAGTAQVQTMVTYPEIDYVLSHELKGSAHSTGVARVFETDHKLQDAMVTFFRSGKNLLVGALVFKSLYVRAGTENKRVYLCEKQD